MNPCDEIRALLPLFVGGDLEAPLSAGVRAHLGLETVSGGGSAGCAPCTRALEDLNEVRAVLLDLPERSPAASIDVWPAVRRSLVTEGLLGSGAAVGVGDQAPHRTRSAPSRPAGRLLTLRRVAAAVAAVAVLALGVYLARPEGPAQPGTGEESVPGVGPNQRQRIAAGGGESADEPLVPAAAPSGLRRLGPAEQPLYVDALPFMEGMPGWPQVRTWPGRPRTSVDPSRPTFASDRSLR